MKLAVLASVCGLMVLTNVAKAEIGWLDNNPFAIDGQTGLISITEKQGNHTYTCDVAYAVFESLDYVSNGGVDPSNGAEKYIYAYQLFNSAISNTDVKVFGVQIPDGITVDNIVFDNAAGILSGVTPHSEKLLNNLIVWRFDNNPIEPSSHSAVVLFTSNFGPGQGNADLHSGNIDGLTGVSIVGPAPTPEPATLFLLGLGSALSLKLGRKK